MIMIQNDSTKKVENDTEQKALIYENSFIRGELQRIGGKSPRTYLQLARERDREKSILEKSVPLENEVEKLLYFQLIQNFGIRRNM